MYLKNDFSFPMKFECPYFYLQTSQLKALPTRFGEKGKKEKRKTQQMKALHSPFDAFYTKGESNRLFFTSCKNRSNEKLKASVEA